MKRAADDDREAGRAVRPRQPVANVKQFYSKSKDADDLGLGIKDWRTAQQFLAMRDCDRWPKISFH